MRHGLLLLSTGLVMAFGLGAPPTADAQAERPNATHNQCWGDLASQMGQRGIMGQHSSAHGFFTPDAGSKEPRLGVANQGRATGAGEPGDGGQGNHAVAVGQLAASIDPVTGQPIENGEPMLCDGTPGNPGPAAVP